MSYIVDRRLNGKNKSTVNRQRFLRRYKKHIKKAVSEAVNKRSITDLEHGESVSIPQKDISEPRFSHKKGGKREAIHPGNKDFMTGDRIKRPSGGAGGGGGGEGEASNSGEGMDEFSFQITQDEFLEFLFEDLELPNLVKRQLAGIESFKVKRAGVVSVGNPSKINIIRSLRQATGRRVAFSAASKRRLKRTEAELAEELEKDSIFRDSNTIKRLEELIAKLKRKIAGIPFIDDIDLRYNLHVKVPQPTSKAVMFCLMDVSGSMNQSMKDMAKRFFILLYMFLKRNYDKIEVVFIRHHTSAKEVDEDEFFYSRETGGTIVSSALKMMKDIMQERYPGAPGPGAPGTGVGNPVSPQMPLHHEPNPGLHQPTRLNFGGMPHQNNQVPLQRNAFNAPQSQFGHPESGLQNLMGMEQSRNARRSAFESTDAPVGSGLWNQRGPTEAPNQAAARPSDPYYLNSLQLQGQGPQRAAALPLDFNANSGDRNVRGAVPSNSLDAPTSVLNSVRDDSLIVDSLFGPVGKSTATSDPQTILPGLQGLSINSDGLGGGMWGSSLPGWNEPEAAKKSEPGQDALYGGTNQLHSTEDQLHPAQSRFNWGSTNGSVGQV